MALICDAAASSIWDPSFSTVSRIGLFGSGRYIMVLHHMLDCEAGKSLTPHEMAVLIRVMQRYNGGNNGKIHMSSRDAAKLANINKDTAAKSLRSLTAKGFLRLSEPSSFNTNGRRASSYEITSLPLSENKPAKRSYQNWKEDIKNNSSSDNRAGSVRN